MFGYSFFERESYPVFTIWLFILLALDLLYALWALLKRFPQRPTVRGEHLACAIVFLVVIGLLLLFTLPKAYDEWTSTRARETVTVKYSFSSYTNGADAAVGYVVIEEYDLSLKSAKVADSNPKDKNKNWMLPKFLAGERIELIVVRDRFGTPVALRLP